MSTILVVDDDRAVQSMLVDLLQERGYSVETCRNGREAMSRVEREAFGLLILDVLIPHVNGFAMMELIRARPELRELPVIMISGIYRSRNHRNEMTSRFGVIDYLDKPLATDKLLSLVESVLGPGTPQTTESSGENTQIETVDEQREREASEEQLVEPQARQEKVEVEAEARASFRPSAFLMQGSIKRTPVAAVLGKLWHDGASGALLLRNDKVKKIIHLNKGAVHSVKSNLVSECLGRLLVRERLISAEQCQESIQQMKETNKRQGELLVQMGCITQRNLAFALEMQLETKIFDVFHWDSGEYRFNPSVALPPAEVELEWQGAALVVEGIRRAFNETRLRALMVPILDVPLAFREAHVDLAPLKLTSVEQNAAAALRSGHTTRELLDGSPADPPDALRVVYTLIALDLLIPASAT